MKPLTDYLDEMRSELSPPYASRIANFDPHDGGINAQALFLLEAPGPKAIQSGFISRNNPDPSAKNTCMLLEEAGLPRSRTLLWNIVPWYVGDGNRIRPVLQSDIDQAMPYLSKLLEMLTELRYIVLVGRKAQSAQTEIQLITDLPFYHSHHPSARVLNSRSSSREEILAAYSNVAGRLRAEMC